MGLDSAQSSVVAALPFAEAASGTGAIGRAERALTEVSAVLVESTGSTAVCCCCDAPMPSRKRGRIAVELSQEELEERNTRRRLNASARAARHADRENGLTARCRVDILDQAQHVLAVDSAHLSFWHRQPQTTRQDSTLTPLRL